MASYIRKGPSLALTGGLGRAQIEELATAASGSACGAIADALGYFSNLYPRRGKHSVRKRMTFCRYGKSVRLR